MERRFEGKGVIVTGGNRGIGRAIVERFAAEGADVLVTGRNEETIDATVAAVEARRRAGPGGCAPTSAQTPIWSASSPRPRLAGSASTSS